MSRTAIVCEFHHDSRLDLRGRAPDLRSAVLATSRWRGGVRACRSVELLDLARRRLFRRRGTVQAPASHMVPGSRGAVLSDLAPRHVATFRYARRYLWVVLASAFLVSILLAEYYIAIGKENATFFLLHGRIFEFCIGAMMVWLVDHRPGNRYLSHIALILGLGRIFIGVFCFTSTTPFPGVYALVPCLGTGLVIFGGMASGLRVILANWLAVGIGKISYSLYLVHWPLIVFYKYHRLAPLTHLEQAGISVAAILIAALMYTFIEQPFRGSDQSPLSI